MAKKGIEILTSSKLSSRANAVLRQGSKETILKPAAETQNGLANPCESSNFYSNFFSPSSFKNLRDILAETTKKGFAFFKLLKKGKAFTTTSGLYVKPSTCDEKTVHPVGCLNLQTLDDVNCCDRKLVFSLQPNLTYFNLCTGLPQESTDSALLRSKQAALFAGLRLVTSTLPQALKKMIKLRTLQNLTKIEIDSGKNLSFWSPPPKPANSTNACLPVEIDVLSSPPQFISNQLVTPAEYPEYKQHLDSMLSYLDYLRLMKPKLEINGDFSAVKFRDNNLTPRSYFLNLFSFAVLIYSLPTAILTLLVFILSGCFISKIKISILSWYSQCTAERNAPDFPRTVYRILAYANRERDIELQSMASAPPLIAEPDNQRRARALPPPM